MHAPGGNPSRVGVAPLGIADGYRRPRSDAGARVLIAGRRVPILGVSLGYMSLDLSDLPSARAGDAVVLLGPDGDDNITIEEVAAWQDCVPYQLLMSLNRRLPYRYLGGAH